MAESTSSSGKKDIVPINVRDPFWKDPFFSSTWDEFDQMRSDMMTKSKQFWSKVDEDFANFDDTVRKSHDEMDRQMAPFQPQLPRWAIPDDLKSKWNPITTQDANEVIKVKQNDDKFEVTLDVPQYRPEELKVTVINNVLSIEGAHNESKKETKDEDGSFASSVQRQFSRKWTLPPNCDSDKVQSNLSSDGILMVTCPKEISGALSHEGGQKALKN